MTNNQKIVGLLIGLASVTVGFAAIGFSIGYRWNESISYPPGLYRLTQSSTTYQKGDLVLFCPPNNAAIQMAKNRGYLKFGTCDGGVTPVMKRIVGTSGDKITFNHTIHINGHKLDRTYLLKEDGEHRPLPQLSNFTIEKNHVFVISDHLPTVSFDSRYYGAVPATNIIGHIMPIWTP
ncbi:conjugative transfer signal peptidase TraF [Photobacterium sp. NCIMB 13483]|uniref:conjugative transfer signal peptidase TraF n=1 Tax=Photobacterium sp. NCIMB 13483 TaxID=2022103 RepID=UPI000D150B42|nr:conjugative transfer signal peptidase TraF [Photobacterium sp. NCIMB 13483]PST87296.1 conjugative transfer signal peptidase TraF [Photobacterium sp. NCIMB 13483]